MTVRWQKLKPLYRLLFAPKATANDAQRQELVLNILLTGTILLSVMALAVTIRNHIVMGASYEGAPPSFLFVICVIFIGLFVASRSGLYLSTAYVFVCLFFLIATGPLFAEGAIVTQSVLAYSFIVVITGILLGSISAFGVAACASAMLLVFVHVSQAGVFATKTATQDITYNYGDSLVYAIFFMLIALVSWLANRDTRRALVRARDSEAALRHERDNLEQKVRERTRELEESQLRRTLQLQRFAEFGRVSATLIHDLASPLSAVSLSLSQLEDQQRTGLLEAAKQSTAAMERYVVSARQQLQKETELTDFNPASEIRRQVLPLFKNKTEATGVEIELDAATGLTLHGNSVQFDHIVTNLLTNAIDAYDGMPDVTTKPVEVRLWQEGKQVCLTVLDHGVGIRARALPRVFDAFYTTKYTAENLGLGLSTVKHLAETSFNGSITVTSESKEGTCFTVKFPVA